jgi:hypothetical protein
LRARPALGVSVGEQQSHYCNTEQNKTDRAHGSSPSPSFRAANAMLDRCRRLIWTRLREADAGRAARVSDLTRSTIAQLVFTPENATKRCGIVDRRD